MGLTIHRQTNCLCIPKATSFFCITCQPYTQSQMPYDHVKQTKDRCQNINPEQREFLILQSKAPSATSMLSMMFWYLQYSLMSVSSVMAIDAMVRRNSHLRCHDATFVPDFYLRVTFENHTVACQRRMSVLVNGTSSGPKIHLMPGKTSWVRVCNDMDIYNTNMVLVPLVLEDVRTDAY